MTVNEPNFEGNLVYDYLERRFGQNDPRSSGYRSVRSFMFEAELIRNVIRRYDGDILDVGCGHGLISGQLVAEGRCVFGLDYNRIAISSAASKGLVAVRGDAFSMPFKEASFDVVLSTEFIHNFDPNQTRRLLGELARVTRPGGSVVLIWRMGASLMRYMITSSLRIIDWARRRPALKLFHHRFDTVYGWAKERQLEIIDAISFCPLLGLTTREAKSFGSKVIGTSYLSVLRRCR